MTREELFDALNDPKYEDKSMVVEVKDNLASTGIAAIEVAKQKNWYNKITIITFSDAAAAEIKKYDLDITIAVKSYPILNDACMVDAIDAGLDEFGEIVEIGAGTVGYVDSEISEDFREIFKDHEFIISKGMGNYEILYRTMVQGQHPCRNVLSNKKDLPCIKILGKLLSISL